MARPRRTDRATVADQAITIRLTPSEREVLEALVEEQSAEFASTGAKAGFATVIRGLIRREAARKGLLREAQGSRKRDR